MSFTSFHRLLVRACFYPLACCTMLGAAFLGFRYFFTGQTTHGYFVWNTFLAWLPYLCSVVVLYLYESRSRRRWLMTVLGATWLAFFPNAPYLVTDFVHFDASRSFAWWYDVGLMLTFAWTGCFLAIVSLRIMQEIVRSKLGRVAGWTFVCSAIALSGVGIYMGRFARLNSWNLLTQPLSIARMLASGAAHAANHPRTIGVTLMFSAFLLVCYLTFIAARPILEDVHAHDR
jgi:uncharacterized membrane protein